MLKRCLVLLISLATAVSAQLPQVLPTNRPHLRDWPDLIGRDPVLARGLEAMRQKVRWPRPLPVRFADTGKVNAWYQPGDHSVTVDYSLLDFLYKTFDSDARYRPQAETLALRAGRFILLHELGHALMDELNLPYTGKNEDCADQLAVLLADALEGPEGRLDAQAGAQWFLLMGWNKQQDVSKVHFWDEHSFDLQRYFNVLIYLECAHPGSLPNTFQSISPERLERARRRWPRKLAAWSHHLQGRATLWAAPAQPPPPPAAVAPRRITMAFEDTAESDLQMIRSEMMRHPFAPHLNSFAQIFKLPRDLAVDFVDGRKPVFRYLPEQHRVVVSYGWVLDVGTFLGSQTQDGQTIMSMLGAIMVLELSERTQQMLLEELQVPITGEPEDAAVELLTLAFADNAQVVPLLRDAAEYYRWKARANPHMLTYDYSSEDDLHHQRFLDLYMALYVARPQQFAWVKSWIPESRLRRAQAEWPRKNQNWERLILPYARTQAGS